MIMMNDDDDDGGGEHEDEVDDGDYDIYMMIYDTILDRLDVIEVDLFI